MPTDHDKDLNLAPAGGPAAHLVGGMRAVCPLTEHPLPVILLGTGGWPDVR